MTLKFSAWLAVAMLGAMLSPAMADDTPAKAGVAQMTAGRITGIGGIFFKAKDPKALAAWYRDVLGMKLEDWGGAALRYDDPQHPPALIWGVFADKTDYFAPSPREYMINYAVDDIDAFLAKIEAKGVKVLKRDYDSDPNGKFAWIVDPEGSKIELWQPK